MQSPKRTFCPQIGPYSYSTNESSGRPRTSRLNFFGTGVDMRIAGQITRGGCTRSSERRPDSDSEGDVVEVVGSDRINDGGRWGRRVSEDARKHVQRGIREVRQKVNIGWAGKSFRTLCRERWHALLVVQNGAQFLTCVRGSLVQRYCLPFYCLCSSAALHRIFVVVPCSRGAKNVH